MYWNNQISDDRNLKRIGGAVATFSFVAKRTFQTSKPFIRRNGNNLRVFENTVLRRIHGTNGNEVTGEWRKLHKEELNDLYCSPNIIRLVKSRRMRWAGHVARMEERRGVYSVLVGKPEGKRPFGETQA